jgi:hypothetical protein
MPSSERVSAGGAAAARERRDTPRREDGKERTAGLGFAVPRWRKRRGSGEEVEVEVEMGTAMVMGGRGEEEEDEEGAVAVCRVGFRKTSASLSRRIIRFGGHLRLRPSDELHRERYVHTVRDRSAYSVEKASQRVRKNER